MLGEDPTKPLIELALQQRELNLGTAFGDARTAEADVTRFECYAAPFRVELGDQLRAVLGWDLGTSAITTPRRPGALTALVTRVRNADASDLVGMGQNLLRGMVTRNCCSRRR